MRRKSHYLAAAMAAVVPIVPIAAHAEGDSAQFGLDTMIGFVNDDSEATGPDNDTTIAVLPSIAFGDQFVVQGDGMVAGHRNDTVAGGAVHAGVRVSQGGYVGAYGSYTDNSRHSGLEIYRLGGELDFDLGEIGLATVAGYEHTQSGSFLIRTTATDDIYDVYDGRGRFFAFSDIRFRPSRNFRLSVGHRYNGGQSSGAVGAAMGFGPNIVVFAEGRLGKRDNNAGFIGLRARFGGGEAGSSLLDNRLMEDLFAPSNTRRSLAVPLPPPEIPDEDNGCGSCGGYCSA